MDEPVAVRTTLAGRWGPVLIAATDRGVVAIEWLTTAVDFDATLARRLGGRVAESGTVEPGDNRENHLRNAANWVEAFLAGRQARNAPPFDLSDRPAWDQHVLEAVAEIGRASCRERV